MGDVKANLGLFYYLARFKGVEHTMFSGLWAIIQPVQGLKCFFSCLIYAMMLHGHTTSRTIWTFSLWFFEHSTHNGSRTALLHSANLWHESSPESSCTLGRMAGTHRWTRLNRHARHLGSPTDALDSLEHGRLLGMVFKTTMDGQADRAATAISCGFPGISYCG